MHFSVAQLADLFQRKLCGRVGRCAYRKGDKDLVRVQARIAVAEIHGLEFLNRLYDYGGYEQDIVMDASEHLQRVEQRGGCGAE